MDLIGVTLKALLISTLMVVNPNKKKLKDKMTKRSPTNLKKRMMMKTQGMAKKRMPLRKKSSMGM